MSNQELKSTGMPDAYSFVCETNRLFSDGHIIIGGACESEVIRIFLLATSGTRIWGLGPNVRSTEAVCITDGGWLYDVTNGKLLYGEFEPAAPITLALTNSFRP